MLTHGCASLTMQSRRRKTPRRSSRPADGRQGREPTNMELDEEPVAAVAVSDLFPRSLGAVSHLRLADLARIEQASFVLAASDAASGVSDIGVFWTGYRSWTPHHNTMRYIPAGSVILTLIRSSFGIIVVATFVTARDRYVQWCPYFADEEKRTTEACNIAIDRACRFLDIRTTR